MSMIIRRGLLHKYWCKGCLEWVFAGIFFTNQLMYRKSNILYWT